MKTIPYRLDGRTYHLCMNGAALFDIYEKFGTSGGLTDPIEGTDKAAFQATCWMLHKLSEQGELVRRYEGHDRAPYLLEGQLRAILSPADVIVARGAIKEAVAAGFRMEVEKAEPEEIDLGLMELEAKEGKALTRAQFLQATTQLLHLGVKEGLLMTVGEVLDLLELEKQRRGAKERDG